MSVIFLKENDSLSKKALKAPFPDRATGVFEVPLKKMRKRATNILKERIEKSSALFLSDPDLSHLISESNCDDKAFFYSLIPDLLKNELARRTLSGLRLIIFSPTEELVLSVMSRFTDIALCGDGAFSVSNSVFETTGAPLPVVSGSSDNDIVFVRDDVFSLPHKIAVGFNLIPGKNSIGSESLAFIPKGMYEPLYAIMGRPLSLSEAAKLKAYDKKATFNTTIKN